MSTLAGYGAGFAPPAAAEPPSLQVTGTGEVPVAPDTARISLGFSARAPQAAAAYEQAAAALNQVVRALVQAGVPTEMMQTQEVALNPVYRPPEDGGAGELSGYEASATLAVTLHDLARVGALIDLAVSAGANRVLGVQFTLRNRQPAEGAALAQAVQDAQRQAVVLAQSLGVALGPVRQVESLPGAVPEPFLARTFAEAVPVLPGQVTVSRSVRVVYGIQLAGGP